MSAEDCITLHPPAVSAATDQPLADATILVTGAGGFIARAFIDHLAARGHRVRAVSRHPVTVPAGVELRTVPHYHDAEALDAVLEGVDVVVHLAAIAHRAPTSGPDGGGIFAWNVTDTTAVATAAARAGVRRFVLVSSIGVLGNRNKQEAFTESSSPSPSEPYAISKWQAECALRWIHGKHPGMAYVIVRPPLVYGPHAPGNFRRAMLALARGLPLPLRGLNNQRSFIALDNLLSLLECCSWHPAAANQVFVAADGEDVTTADFIARLGRAIGHPARLFWVPTWLVRLAAGMVRRGPEVDRLVADLRVDAEKARRLLGWQPQLSLDEGLRRCAVSTSTAQDRA